MPSPRWLAALTLGALLALSPPASAKPAKKARVVWTDIRVPESDASARYEHILKDILAKEGRKERWGKGRKEPVAATLEVKSFSVVVSGDVVRVTCAAVGKIKGLGSAHSRFSFGGLPAERAALERHVLELVARGIITRLAEMARAQTDTGWKVGRAPPEAPPQKLAAIVPAPPLAPAPLAAIVPAPAIVPAAPRARR